MAIFFRLNLVFVAVCILLFSCTGNDGNDGTSTSNTWSVPEEIGNDDIADADMPQIAFDYSGKAIAIWQQSDGNVTSIWTILFDGTNWGTPEKIDGDDNGDTYYPQIAFDGDGNAIAVWKHFDGTQSSIWTKRFDGTNWRDSERFEGDYTSYASYFYSSKPQIAVADDGSAIVVWSAKDGYFSSIWVNRFDGINWGVSEIIADGYNSVLYGTQSTSLSDPQIAVADDGSAIVVWQKTSFLTSSSSSIRAKHFDGTNWGTTTTVAGDTSMSPNIASDGTGNAIAFWVKYGDDSGTWTSRFDGTDWGTPEKINDYHYGFRDIILNGAGKAIAIWAQADDDLTSIWSIFFDGTNWGTPEKIGGDFPSGSNDIEFPPNGVYNLKIDFDDTGKGIAVWWQHDFPLSIIWSIFFNGTSWSIPEKISYDAYYLKDSEPQIAFDGFGNATAVWTQSDGKVASIWSNRLE